MMRLSLCLFLFTTAWALRSDLSVDEDNAVAKKTSDNQCHPLVPNSITRDCVDSFGYTWLGTCGWFNNNVCKCPHLSQMSGEDPACKAAGRKFDPQKLKGKGCYCKNPEYTPIKDQEPHFNCKTESSSIREFVESAREWCRSDKLPADKRIPEKMRGLYWLMDLNLQNFAFCTSIAEWDAETMEMTLVVWTHFTFYQKPEVAYDGHMVPKMAWDDAFFKLSSSRQPLIYKMRFNSSDMSFATIIPNSLVFHATNAFTLVELQQTDDGLVKSVEPGDIYDRPCYLFTESKNTNYFRYYAVRVLYDNGTINEPNLKLMEEKEKKLFEDSGSKIVVYHPMCPNGAR